jgi:RNA polymerase sigma-70 factor (ECF subfamily)
MDDAALLRAAASGDEAAFAAFMREHHAAVRRSLLAFGGSEADADDALQETFISAWRSASTYTGGANARGWLYAIARNAVRHQVRRRVGEPEHLESIECLAEQAGWGDIAAPDTESLARETLRDALQRLPVEEREVLTLRELDGFSGEETAALLGLTLPAMKSRLHRSRLHLAAVVRSLATTSPRSTADA